MKFSISSTLICPDYDGSKLTKRQDHLRYPKIKPAMDPKSDTIHTLQILGLTSRRLEPHVISSVGISELSLRSHLLVSITVNSRLEHPLTIAVFTIKIQDRSDTSKAFGEWSTRKGFQSKEILNKLQHSRTLEIYNADHSQYLDQH